MEVESKNRTRYEPARGSAAVVCWILIVACAAIVVLSLLGWAAQIGGGAPLIEILLSILGILACTARLRGWAPPPKGTGGGGGGM